MRGAAAGVCATASLPTRRRAQLQWQGPAPLSPWVPAVGHWPHSPGVRCFCGGLELQKGEAVITETLESRSGGPGSLEAGRERSHHGNASGKGECFPSIPSN